jgi:hypothetical protein
MKIINFPSSTFTGYSSPNGTFGQNDFTCPNTQYLAIIHLHYRGRQDDDNAKSMFKASIASPFNRFSVILPKLSPA